MNRESGLLRPAILAAGALAGLFGAHALDYWLLVSDPVRRQALLHATGHAWIPQIESVAVACALASVVGAVWSGLRRRASRPSSVGATALRLAAAQSIGFVTLELGERLFAGAPLHHLTPMLLGAGIAMQIATGGIVAIGFALLSAAGRRIARALAGASFRSIRGSLVFPSPVSFSPSRRLWGAATDPVRGPPLAVTA